MSNSLIVGFTAKAGTGKSTAASFLEQEYGFVRHNFKDKLIEELKQNFGQVLDELAFIYDRSVDELFQTKPPAMRKLMQDYGQMRREENPMHWVYGWMGGLPEGLVATDDVRYLNEAEAIRKFGGIVIRLVREDIKDTSGHISETEQDLIVPDYIIHCVSGDLDILHTDLKTIIDAERTKKDRLC